MSAALTACIAPMALIFQTFFSMFSLMSPEILGISSLSRNLVGMQINKMIRFLKVLYLPLFKLVCVFPSLH